MPIEERNEPPQPERQPPDDTSPAVAVVQKEVKRKRKLHHLLVLILLWFVGCTVILGLAILLFIQLPVTKRLVVHELVKTVESSTNATLVIGDVEGNLLQGFILHDVSLKLKTGTRYDSFDLIHADQVLAKYSLIRWIRRDEIGITSMVLVRPKIQLLKFAGDTVWNYSLLTKYVPTAPQAPPKPFTQIVDLASLRIQNGSVIVRDYNFPERPTKLISGTGAEVKERDIDWSNVQLQDLDLDSRFYAHGSSAQSARVNHLRFTEKQSGFFVQHLAFSAYLDSLQARIDDAKITTGHTDIGFSVSVIPPSILKTKKYSSLGPSEVNLAMKGPVVSTYELKQFLPSALGFLGGSPGIDLVCTGHYDDLHIKNLALDFKGHGGISITGDLKNLHKTDSLWMNLAVEGRNLTNATLNTYVPGLHLPSLTRFGVINIPRLVYTGEPLNFHTVFDARSTGAGNIAADAFLNFHHHETNYRAGIRTQNFNLAAVIQKPAFESSISAEGKIAGNGTNWKTLTTDLTLKATAPSTVGKRRIDAFDLAGTLKQGNATIDRLVATVAGGPDVNVHSAAINLVSAAMPFRFDGTVNDLKLADIIPGAEGNPARIHLEANLQGSAKDFEDAIGTLHGKITNLVVKNHPLGDVTVDAKMASLGSGENSLVLKSEIADIDIEKRFRLGDLITTVPQHVNALLTAIQRREFPEANVHYPLESCGDSLDFAYRINVKDLRPVAAFMPQLFMLSEGELGGNVWGCRHGDLNLTLKSDSLGFIMRNRPDSEFTSITSLDTSVVAHIDSSIRATLPDSLKRTALSLPSFTSGVPRLHVTPTHINLVAHNISDDPSKVLDHLDATVHIASDSVVRLGSSLFYRPIVNLAYKNQAMGFDVATNYNAALDVHLMGNAHFPERQFDLAFDSIVVAYFNRDLSAPLTEYKWANEGPSHIVVGEAGSVTIDTLTLVHPLRRYGNFPQLRLSLGGSIHHDSVDAWAQVDRFDINSIPRIYPVRNSAAFSPYAGAVRDLHLGLSGTLERPDIETKLFMDHVSYGEPGNRIIFDSNAVDLHYKDQILSGSVALHVDTIEAAGEITAFRRDSASELRANIQSIPMIIALKRGPNYAADSAANVTKPLSASFDASHFPLDVATPLLPIFKSMEGTAELHFSVSGTRENTVYAGQASIDGGEFLLAANNMWYRLYGPLSFANNSLKLNSLTLRNIDADDPLGVATLNGFLNFSGFSVTNFDIAAHTDRLMVLSDNSRESLHAIYGPVTISTSGQDLHFHNTFKQPWLNGTIEIVSANLTLPQTGNGGQTVSSEGIVYRTLPPDSSTYSEDSTIFQGHRWGASPASVMLVRHDDSLFSNRMKEIYLNEEGRSDLADTMQADANTQERSPSLGPSFADRLMLDLNVGIQNSADIVMPFSGVFGLLGAQLNAELKSEGLIAIQRSEIGAPVTVNGTIDLTPNSTFRFYQTFNLTHGQITFQNSFTNPLIDITASYTGTHHNAKTGTDDQAKVEMQLSGTKDRPDLTTTIYTDESGAFEPIAESSKESAIQDAVYFLASGGYFKNDLLPNEQQTILAKMSTNISTQLFSSMIQSYLGSTGSEFAIRQASLVSGGGAQFTAAWKDIVIHYNYSKGTVVNGISSGESQNFEVDIPMTMFSVSPTTRRMQLELQYNMNPSSSAATSLVQQPQFLGKFVWTITRFN